MSEISLLSPGTEIARWAVLPRWAVFGKFPLLAALENVHQEEMTEAQDWSKLSDSEY